MHWHKQMMSASPLREMQMLANHIIERCLQDGWVTFAAFMETSLYHPVWGYYTGASTKFGPQGDFITAPTQCPLFSQCIGNYLLETQTDTVIEIGAGNAQMACDILSHLKKHQALPSKYYILEISPTLQKRQQEKISQCHPEYVENVVWLAGNPDTPIHGTLIANEIIDSLPVHRFHIDKNYQILEQGVKVDENQQLQLAFNTPQSPNLAESIDNLLLQLENPLPPGYTSEIHLNLPTWLNQLQQSFKGKMLFIDYGFRRSEYYHWQRYQGTLMCHHQHRAHDNPLINIGHQDITAHVDFDYLAECAIANQCDVVQFETQANFLMQNGLCSLLAEQLPHDNTLSQQAQLLTAPHEMGDLFKVMEIHSRL